MLSQVALPPSSTTCFLEIGQQLHGRNTCCMYVFLAHLPPTPPSNTNLQHYPRTPPSNTTLAHLPPTLPSHTSLQHYPRTPPSNTTLQHQPHTHTHTQVDEEVLPRSLLGLANLYYVPFVTALKQVCGLQVQ
jgi:hypothetical protein